MFTEYVEHDSEDFFSDGNGCIGGIATLRLECSHQMNGDIGGHDGLHVEATFVSLKVGNVTFTADQIAEMFGSKVIAQFETWVAEYEETRVD